MNWCRVCCTGHGPERPCPGDLLATGPERAGWRVSVQTDASVEAYGVLLAPAGMWWRARVLTFPRALWTLPGGAATLKFAGPTPQDAERQAIDFIEAHCRRNGYTVRAHPRTGAHAPVDPDERGSTAASRRKERHLPVKFGRDLATQRAQTENVSLAGLFVSTADPLPPPSPVLVQVEIGGRWEDLAGTVCWARLRAEAGKPLGMGIGLTRAPRAYQEFVRRLDPASPQF